MKLTIKDFINYGSPCVICGKKMSVFFTEVIVDKASFNYIDYSSYIENQLLIVNLIRSYYSKFELIIDCKTNKFSILKYEPNVPKIKKIDIRDFIQSKIFRLQLSCNNKEMCSSICSSYLKFNMDKEFIYPIDVKEEYLYVKIDSKEYFLDSNNTDEFGMEKGSNICCGDLKIKLPPTSLIKLKNKDLIIKRIKEYLLFS
jgi:hypothetical protein